MIINSLNIKWLPMSFVVAISLVLSCDVDVAKQASYKVNGLRTAIMATTTAAVAVAEESHFFASGGLFSR